jgi:hypothetical protein
MVIVLEVYLIVLAIVSAIGFAKWTRLCFAEKVVALQMLMTFVAETAAFFVDRLHGSSEVVYHFFSPIEFFMISLYFNSSVRILHKNNIGFYIGISGFLLAILNVAFFQNIKDINSHFLLFEGTATIIYCLLSFHQILLDEERLPYAFAQFWISTCLIIFWSTTFTGWGLYAIMSSDNPVFLSIFAKVLTAANFIFYLGIAVVFLNYKKLIPSGA